MTSSESNLVVFVILFEIGWWDFDLFSFYEIFEFVLGHLFRSGERLTHVFIKFASEIITINNTEDSFVEIDIDSYVEVFPGIVFFGFADFGWDFLSFDKDSLWNSTVFLSGFGDVDCSVTKVVVYIAFTKTVV